ncbi:eukaryotic translation initiation factor 3 subunit C isoform X2 [Centruroides vittatus]|uniref:eukaryotic translation initiation factor 3 subunit C isoform X2 n=1 Tax=Centruroides vittatus TaxID=120091 RepID=UPI00350F11AB
MSRFFATGSESESESSSSEEEQAQSKTTGITSAFTFSDEEEETKRVVRSAREKRYEELVDIIKQVKNHKKIKDMSKLLTSFENLSRAFMKAKPVIDKEEGGMTPKFYIRCLVELEDFINNCWEDREGRKNMSKNNSKSLATLRQKLRKYNKDFESEIANYRENPDVEDEEKDEEEDMGSDDEIQDEDFIKKPIIKEEKEEVKSKFIKGSDDEESDDDSMEWGTSSEEESSLSSDDEKYAGNLAAKFLKKTADDQKEMKKREKKRDKERKERKREDDDDDEGKWEEVKGGVPLIMEKPKMFAKDAEINHQVVLKKLTEILAARGKKGTDRSEQIDLLNELMDTVKAHALGPAMEVKIMFAIISAIYDYNPNIATCMKIEMWQKCLEFINKLLDILIANPSINVGEHISEDSEVFSSVPYRVRGCILTMIERMDEEFTKMLQGCDAHSPEYVERLKDEKEVCLIIQRVQDYLEERGTPSELCRIYLRHIEHLYYKFDQNVFKWKESRSHKEEKEQQENAVNGEEGSEEEKKDDVPEEPKETSLLIMDRLCKFIYVKDSTDRIRTQAMLCHIYHHALHDNWFEARDLMLMSHLQENIQHSDVPTQILYNRALVQLGLCSFRHGNIKDAHNALLDIQSGGRAKELLAQGLLPQRQHERTTEQEKIEKRRQVPFHKHINLELLECVYLVSAMLLEIPYMSAHELDGRKRMISKSFHHQLRNSERQPLVGPPESMREHVVAASKAMRIGNWRQCKNYIINEKMNAKVWDLFYQADKVRDMISQKIQEESLRTYLFTYSHVYDSISMNILSEMFELDKSVVHSIISKMIINEELMASLDEPTQTVVMHRTEPSRIQALSLQLADKVTNLIDQNERLAEVKQGSFFGRSMGQQSGFRDSSYQKNVYNQQGNFREVNYQKGTYSQSSNFRDNSYQKTAYGADRWG